MKKSSENRQQLYCRILRMTFSTKTIKKIKNDPKKHPKTKNSKSLKCHIRRPQMKKFRKHIIVVIEIYKE